MANVNTLTLSNGMRVVMVKFPDINTVTIRCWISCGSAYESAEENGISHFLEHMIFRGNEKLGDSHEMNLKFEELGGDINASTSTDLTEYWMYFHSRFLDLGIRRFCHFLRYPLFQKIEVEREIIQEEIKDDFNEEGYCISPESLVAESLWPDQSRGFPVIGTEKTVSEISLEQLKNWHKLFYRPERMMIGVCGNFDQDEVLEILETELKGLSSGEVPLLPVEVTKPLKENQLILVPDQDNQFNLDWSFPLTGLEERKRLVLQLIGRIMDDGFSSRLQRSVREEKGLVYDISGGFEFLQNSSVFSISAIVGREKLTELCSCLTSLIHEVLKDGIKNSELQLAKLRFQTSLDYHSDTAQGIMQSTAHPFIYPHALNVDKIIPLVEEISLEEVNKAAYDLFSNKNTVLALVGPIKEIDRDKLKDNFSDWLN